jgi:hypothetical protein
MYDLQHFHSNGTLRKSNGTSIKKKKKPEHEMEDK